MRCKFFGLFLFIGILLPIWAYADEGPHVEMFSPQGTVKGVRQVSVRFSEQMVPFGDPRGLIEPFDIDCPEKGTSRWADGKNWIYDFERNLPAGVRCEFRLKPGLKALSGNEIGGQQRFLFLDGWSGHQGLRSLMKERGSMKSRSSSLPWMRNPTEESVLQHVTFSVEGIQDQIGIRIVEGKEREEIFKVPVPIPEAPLSSHGLHPEQTAFSCRHEGGSGLGKGGDVKDRCRDRYRTRSFASRRESPFCLGSPARGRIQRQAASPSHP